MNQLHRITSIFLAALLVSACGSAPIVNTKWTHPNRDLKTYYQDDAQCLQLANTILFRQLKTAEAKRTTSQPRVQRISSQDFSDKLCTSNQHRDQIHYKCMVKKGWNPEKK